MRKLGPGGSSSVAYPRPLHIGLDGSDAASRFWPLPGPGLCSGEGRPCAAGSVQAVRVDTCRPTPLLISGVEHHRNKKRSVLNLARKLPLVGGLLGASTIILANYVKGDAWVIAILSFAFFSQGMTGLGWAVISDVAPKELVGLTGGIFSFAANVAGVITPILVGFVIRATGSFFYTFIYIGAAALLGALSYVFLLGDIERIRLD